MKLIIAEKPSLGMKIVGAISDGGAFDKHDGYLENDKYIVTWGFGHLFSLIDIEDYDTGYVPEEARGWSLDNLPFMPDSFRFSLKKDKNKKPDAGVKKQFNTIKTLLNRSDVSFVINAGDSDREGEIIIRLILANAGNKKPVGRLWLPDQTTETIRKALEDIPNDSDYDNLANEGYARTFIDWLYGINLSRYATIKSGTLLRVGRVIVPIVKAIYDRDMEIKNFIPEQYFAIISEEETNGEKIELVSKTKFKNDDLTNAQAFCNKYNALTATVTDSKTEKKTIGSGKLYSLSKLQGVLGKRFKMAPAEVLQVVQELYEAGYVTYPRTNTEYLATAEKESIKRILSEFKKDGFNVSFRDSKAIFDDSKIESHSALTPTIKIPDINTLTPKQKNVYETIRNRFIAVFCAEECLVNRSTITIDVGDEETFTLKGDIMIQKGWTEYDVYSSKDKILPSLNKGDVINILFKPISKETKPPKSYTTASLNNFLQNPFKEEMSSKENSDDTDDEDDYKAILSGVEIGTEATRSGIIKNAIDSEYISLKNDVYHIEDTGIFYIQTLEKLMINMNKEKTVELSQALKSVYKDEMTIGESVVLVKDELTEIFSHKDEVVIDSNGLKINGFIGDCPICGKPIKKQTWGYSCTGYKDGCKFSISGVIAGKKITEKTAIQLLEKGETSMISGFKGKTGKPFSAKLKIDENNKVAFVFENTTSNKNTEEISCVCPNCGGKIINDKWAWKCEDCDFKINYNIAGKTISKTDAEKIIKDGKSNIIKGFKSKSGKSFNAYIVLDENYNTKFEFNN